MSGSEFSGKVASGGGVYLVRTKLLPIGHVQYSLDRIMIVRT